MGRFTFTARDNFQDILELSPFTTFILNFFFLTRYCCCFLLDFSFPMTFFLSNFIIFVCEQWRTYPHRITFASWCLCSICTEQNAKTKDNRNDKIWEWFWWRFQIDDDDNVCRRKLQQQQHHHHHRHQQQQQKRHRMKIKAKITK